MDEQATQPAQTGEEPAVQPPATTPTEGEKTAEQLEAEQKAADEAQQAEEAEEAAVKKKPWFQRRIDEITKARHEAERRADRLESMMRELIGKQQQPKPEQQPQKPAELPPTRPRPTREAHRFDEDAYLDDMVQWRIEQREAEVTRARQEQEQQRRVQEFQQTFGQRLQQISQDGAKKYTDYESVIGSVPASVFNQEVAFSLSQTDNAHDVAYHLARNLPEAERISKLPPAKQLIELGRLEAAITAAQKRTTQAPPPPNPVGGKAPSTIDPDKLPMDEWLKLRKAGKIT